MKPRNRAVFKTKVIFYTVVMSADVTCSLMRRYLLGTTVTSRCLELGMRVQRPGEVRSSGHHGRAVVQACQEEGEAALLGGHLKVESQWVCFKGWRI